MKNSFYLKVNIDNASRTYPPGSIIKDWHLPVREKICCTIIYSTQYFLYKIGCKILFENG